MIFLVSLQLNLFEDARMLIFPINIDRYKNLVFDGQNKQVGSTRKEDSGNFLNVCPLQVKT